MNNILSFIKEYGGLDFKSLPFNEVDSLVLSQLAYNDLKIIRELDTNEVRVKDLGSKDLAERMSSITWLPKMDCKLIKLMAESNRYKDLVISDFYEADDYFVDGQFTAFTTQISESIIALIYRGTDASFSGWAESLALSFDEEVNSQVSAKKYLEFIADKYDKKFIMAGHSKGGNLVVFAASTVDEKIQDRILKIYNLDGPGFLPEFFQRKDYKSVEEKVVVYMPRRSVVGMLLDGLGVVHVIESKGIFIDQHSPYNWIVKDGMFRELIHVDPISKITNHAINRWLKLVDREERKEIINLLYEICYKTGADDINDILSSKLNNFFKIKSTLSKMDEDEYNLLKKSLDELLKLIKEETFNSIKK